MKKTFFKKFILLVLIVILTTSCSGVKISDTNYVLVPEFSRGMSMILVAEEKNKFESNFGSDVWKIKSGSGDSNFKDYIVGCVKAYVEKLMTLKLFADFFNITLSTRDREWINNAANDYYQSLTEMDLEYIECSLEDIKNLYGIYRLANLAIDSMTRNSDVELSISESKVVSVEYMILSSEERAREIKELLNLRGSSFAYYASSNSEDTNINMIIKRGDKMSSIFPEVFYLATGDVSDVLTYQNKYYLFKCTNDYMEKETLVRKQEILKDLKNKEFNQQFVVFQEKNSVRSNASYWSSIDLSLGVGCRVQKFYEIYDKYFLEE